MGALSAAAIVAVSAILGLAGCLSPGPPPPLPEVDSGSGANEEAMAAADPAYAFGLEWELSGCRERTLLYTVPLAEAQAMVPDGFQVQLNPYSTTEPLGALHLGTFVCSSTSLSGEEYAAAKVGVLIDPPPWAEAGDRQDVYEFGRATSSPTVLAILDRLGLEARPGVIDNSFAIETRIGWALPRGEVWDESGTLYEIEVVQLNIGRPGEAFRYWQRTSQGLLSFDFETQSTGVTTLGSGACEIRPGSWVADALGVESCPPNAWAYGVEDSAFLLKVEYVPD